MGGLSLSGQNNNEAAGINRVKGSASSHEAKEVWITFLWFSLGQIMSEGWTNSGWLGRASAAVGNDSTKELMILSNSSFVLDSKGLRLSKNVMLYTMLATIKVEWFYC